MSASNNKPIKPIVLWAQREDKLFITVEIWDVVDESLQVKEDSVSFFGRERDSRQPYELDLELYQSVKPETLSKSTTGRLIFFTVQKADGSKGFWPRLSKDAAKLPFLRTDFSRWVDPEDGDEDTNVEYGGNPGDFDLSSFGGMNNFGSDDDFQSMGNEDEEAEDEPLDAYVKEQSLKEEAVKESQETVSN